MIHLPFRFRSAKNAQPTSIISETSLSSASPAHSRQRRTNWVLGLVGLVWGGLLIGCNNSTTVSTLGDWTKKSELDGSARSGAAGFVIGNLAYIGTGIDNNAVRLTDLWSYDPAKDSWTQRADFAGPARQLGVGFSVGTKGYIGTGVDIDGVRLNDFWEYDQLTNKWKRVADFGGSGRYNAVAFSIGNQGYVGTGNDGNWLKDFWAYDPAKNAWAKIAGYGGGKREGAVAIVINNMAYIGTGSSNSTLQKDWFVYDPGKDSWTQKADFTTEQAGIARNSGVGFAINGKGYITLGSGTSAPLTVWEYDPATDLWATRGTFEVANRTNSIGFAIGNKGYVTTGAQGTVRFDDLQDFDPTVEQVLP